MRLIIEVADGNVQRVYASRLVRRKMRVQLLDWDHPNVMMTYGPREIEVACIETAPASVKEMAYATRH